MPTFPFTHRSTTDMVTASEWNDLLDALNLLKTSIATDGTLLSTGGILTSPTLITASLLGYTTLLSYIEVLQTPTISAGTLTIDASLGNHAFVTLNANITTFNITNISTTLRIQPVILYFLADGTPRTLTTTCNGVAIRWPGGTPPVLTSTNGKIDKFLFWSLNIGVNIVVGEVIGQNI